MGLLHISGVGLLLVYWFVNLLVGLVRRPIERIGNCHEIRYFYRVNLLKWIKDGRSYFRISVKCMKRLHIFCHTGPSWGKGHVTDDVVRDGSREKKEANSCTIGDCYWTRHNQAVKHSREVTHNVVPGPCCPKPASWQCIRLGDGEVVHIPVMVWLFICAGVRMGRAWRALSGSNGLQKQQLGAVLTRRSIGR